MIRRVFQILPKSLKGFLPWSQTNAAPISNSFCSQKQPPKENTEISQLLKQFMKREEEERLRRIKEDEERKKKEEEERLRRIKEDEERKKKEEEERLEKEEYKKYLLLSVKISGGGIIIAVAAFIINSYFSKKSDQREQAKKIQTRRSELLIQHQKEFLFKEKEFIQGKSIQQYLKPILQSKTNDIELILGVQGIGKTSAMRKLINQKRKEKLKNDKNEEIEQKVYYINLRINENQKKGQETLQIFNKMSELIQAIKLDFDGNTPTTLVIDDINRLEKILNPQHRQQKEMNILNLSNRGVKIILISSSTYFYHSIWTKELFRKHQRRRTHLVWGMKQQQFKQILLKKGQTLKNKQVLVERVINYGLPLRDSIALLNKIESANLSQQQKVIDMLQTDIKSKRNKINSILTTQLIEKKQFSIQASYKLLKGITENNMYDDVQNASIKNCDQFEKKEQFIGSVKVMKEIIELLDKQNLIIMCYPRSRLINKVFLERIKELQQKIKNK